MIVEMHINDELIKIVCNKLNCNYFDAIQFFANHECEMDEEMLTEILYEVLK